MKYLKLFEDLDPKMDELKLLYSHHKRVWI